MEKKVICQENVQIKDLIMEVVVEAEEVLKLASNVEKKVICRENVQIQIQIQVEVEEEVEIEEREDQ